MTVLLHLPRKELLEAGKREFLEHHQLREDRAIKLHTSPLRGAGAQNERVQETLQLARVATQPARKRRGDLTGERERPAKALRQPPERGAGNPLVHRDRELPAMAALLCCREQPPILLAIQLELGEQQPDERLDLRLAQRRDRHRDLQDLLQVVAPE